MKNNHCIDEVKDQNNISHTILFLGIDGDALEKFLSKLEKLDRDLEKLRHDYNEASNHGANLYNEFTDMLDILNSDFYCGNKPTYELKELREKSKFLIKYLRDAAGLTDFIILKQFEKAEIKQRIVIEDSKGAMK